MSSAGRGSASLPRLQLPALTIRAGKTAVLGHSGAGKSSLLNLLVGFEQPTAGELRTTFQTGVDRSPARLPVYWGPPAGGLWSGLTVREHLSVVHPPGQGAETAAFSIDELLAAFDLQRLAGVQVDLLSEGERARLIVARGLSAHPQALVFDEPLTHLGRAHRDAGWRCVLDWQTCTGAALVYATHDLGLVPDADEVIWLEGGEVRQQGTPDIVLAAWNESQRPLPAAESSPQKATALSPSPPPAQSFGGIARMLLMLILSLCGVGCQNATEVMLPVQPAVQWLMPPAGPRVPAPRSICNGHVPGQVYVLDNAGRVLVLDENGDVIRSWFMPAYDVGKPEGVCALLDGRIAVADTHYHRVVLFDQQGQVLQMFGQQGTKPGEFIFPVAIVQSSEGDLFVGEYGGHDRIQRFRADGTFVLEFGSFGTGVGQFQRPSGLVWNEGVVYVVDAFNNRLQRFTQDGQESSVVPLSGGGLHYPYDVALGPTGDLFVAEYGAGSVSRWSTTGELRGRWGSTGDGPDQLKTPWGLTVTPAGRILVADTGNRRLMCLDPP